MTNYSKCMSMPSLISHTHTHTQPCIKRTTSEVLIYTDATMHIFDASSCNGFDHSNHSQFFKKSNRANKLLQNAQNGYGNHPVAYSKDTTGSFLWGKAGGAWSWPLTLNLAPRVKNVWNYTPTPHTSLHDMHRDFTRLYFRVHCYVMQMVRIH
jgi:hypothetical protein